MTAPESGEIDVSGPYANWEPTLQSIAEVGGATLILGAHSTGKTTFSRLLANRAIGAERKCAVLDADPGQSEIGPPACLGLALIDSPIGALSNVTAHSIRFTGSVTTDVRLPEHLTALRSLADMASGRMLIVDTSGSIDTAGARNRIQTEFEILRPSHVVALQRTDELYGPLAPLRRRSDCRIHTPGVSEAISLRPPILRKQRREIRFAAYFRDARETRFSFDDIAFIGTWLGSGNAVAAHILRYLNTTLEIGVRVYHAEMADRRLGLMVNRLPTANGVEMGIVMDTLKAKSVTVTVAPKLKNLLVGLEAANGKLLGLGIVTSLNFRSRLIGILTPTRSPEAASLLRLGLQRISTDGSHAGALKPGDL